MFLKAIQSGVRWITLPSEPRLGLKVRGLELCMHTISYPALSGMHPYVYRLTSIGTGYDLSASTYSPDGRIFQVSHPSPACATRVSCNGG